VVCRLDQHAGADQQDRARERLGQLNLERMPLQTSREHAVAAWRAGRRHLANAGELPSDLQDAGSAKQAGENVRLGTPAGINDAQLNTLFPLNSAGTPGDMPSGP